MRRVSTFVFAAALAAAIGLTTGCLTFESRHEMTVNRARGLAQENRYAEAIALLERYEQQCPPEYAKKVKPMQMAYKTRRYEVAAGNYEETVTLARELAQRGKKAKAIRLIERAENNLTDPAQLKHLNMMKLAYRVD